MSYLSVPRPIRPAEADMLDVAVEPHFDFTSAEYESIHQRSRTTAFQGSRWLDALHRHVAHAMTAEPVTVTVRESGSGRLVLVLPLARTRRNGVVFLEFADFGLCDYLAAVYDPVDVPLLVGDAGLQERITALLPSCDVISLTKLTGADPVLHQLFPAARQSLMRVSVYPAKFGTDWAAWRSATLDRSFGRYLNMKRRRAAKTGQPVFKLVQDPGEIAQAFDVLRTFRADRFRELGIRDVIDSEAVFSFYRRIAVEGARAGTGRTYCLSLSGSPVAVVFGLVHRRTFSLLLVGFDVARHRRLSLGLLAIEDTMRASIEAGDAVYDFTIGDHPYKLQFGAESHPLYERHMACTVRGRIAVFGIKAIREAKRALKPLLKRARTPAAAGWTAH
jgi:CelD/BcsL family acetyltransferase involved in cellulose biosynthesis